MSVKVTWHGHATWQIESEGANILVDPFLSDSPTATVGPDDLSPNWILVSHGHFDHVADVVGIAQRTGAMVVANYEICEWFGKQHSLDKTTGMNLGGTLKTDFGSIHMTLAWHSSQLPDGSYGGNPGGFVVTVGDKKIYLACDTALFSDMQLYGNMGIDLAILPIGDLFTMGVEDSVRATGLIRPGFVMPAHYNTWPPIEQDVNEWAKRIETETSSRPIVLQPGESHEL